MNSLTVASGDAFALDRVPVLTAETAHAELLGQRDAGARLCMFFGARSPAPEHVRVHAVTAHDETSRLQVLSFDVARATGSYPALTPAWPQAHLFEREIAEQFGLHPKGHPWLKPVRGEAPFAGPDLFVPPVGSRTRLDAYPFLQAGSQQMHEVGVGPVHAGIIEPGHFRFLCAGEHVEHLEISLGYQARGTEQRLLGGPDRRSGTLIESLAGDTAVAHMLTWCRTFEALTATRTSARAMAIRAVALELERIANHVGDLAALANDVAFLPAAAWFGRLRGEFLNSLMDLSGNRYGRGLVRPGGVGMDLDPRLAATLLARLETAKRDFARIADVLFEKPSVKARFDEVGRVTREEAEQLGLVGPAARASGLGRDVRADFAHGSYRFLHIPVASAESGDVMARALVRRVECERSLEFLLDLVPHLPPGDLCRAIPVLPPRHGVVVLTEAWRGEIAHMVLTDERGRYARYKLKDPSFHNWSGLALALRGQQISDFPLCNKSFNLSYAGHDL